MAKGGFILEYAATQLRLLQTLSSVQWHYKFIEGDKEPVFWEDEALAF